MNTNRQVWKLNEIIEATRKLGLEVSNIFKAEFKLSMKVRINIYAIVKNLICMMISFELLELRIVVFLLSYLYCQNYVSH
jgi:hypothetical protein